MSKSLRGYLLQFFGAKIGAAVAVAVVVGTKAEVQQVQLIAYRLGRKSYKVMIYDSNHHKDGR